MKIDLFANVIIGGITISLVSLLYSTVLDLSHSLGYMESSIEHLYRELDIIRQEITIIAGK